MKKFLLLLFAFTLSLTTAVADDVDMSTYPLAEVTLEHATVVLENYDLDTIQAGYGMKPKDLLYFTVRPDEGYFFNDGTSLEKTGTIIVYTYHRKTAYYYQWEEQDCSTFTKDESNTWTQPDDDTDYYSKTSGWKTFLRINNTEERMMSYTAISDGLLTFDYAVNNGGTNYGGFHVYLYVNDEKVKTYDYYMTNKDYTDAGYSIIQSSDSTEVKEGDVIKWGFQRDEYYHYYTSWEDGDGGRTGYLGNVRLFRNKEGYVYDINSEFTDYAVHQHSFGTDRICTVCGYENPYALATDVSEDHVSVRATVVREGATVNLAMGDKVAVGEDVTFFVTPELGYCFADNTRETKSVELTLLRDWTNGGTLTAPLGSSAYAVHRHTYPLLGVQAENTTAVILNGTDTVANGSMIAPGDELTVTFTADEDYYFSDGERTKTITLPTSEAMMTSVTELPAGTAMELDYQNFTPAKNEAWTLVTTASPYDDGVRTTGGWQLYTKTYNHESAISTTAPYSGNLSFEYSMNKKNNEDASNYLYLELNGERSYGRTFYGFASYNSYASTHVAKAEGVAVTAGDTLTWVCDPNYDIYHWFYIGVPKITLTASSALTEAMTVIDVSSALTDNASLAVHQHTYDASRHCTVCGAEKPFILDSNINRDYATVTATVERDGETEMLIIGDEVSVGEVLTFYITPKDECAFNDGTSAMKTVSSVTLLRDWVLNGTLTAVLADEYVVHQHVYDEDGSCKICDGLMTFELSDYSTPSSAYVTSVVVKRGDEVLSAGTTLTYGNRLTVTITPLSYAMWADDATISLGTVRDFIVTVGTTDPNDDIQANIDLAICGHTEFVGDVCKYCGKHDALTEDDLKDGAYQIATMGQLMAFADIVNGTNGATQDVAANGVVTADIDFSGIKSDVYQPIGVYNMSWGNLYHGTFDGGGHTITLNLAVDADYQGLFGYIGGATISNVNVAGTVSSPGRGVGCLVGYIGATGTTITNCHNAATLTDGYWGVGGIVGWANNDTNPVITDCSNTGAISGNMSVGGIVGHLTYSNATLERCVNEGSVSGKEEVGGILGYVTAVPSKSATYEVNVTACVNRGTVSKSASYQVESIGGFVGYIYGALNMTGCYNEFSGKTFYGKNATRTTFTSQPTFTRCYDVNTTTNSEVTTYTADQLASGELCYLLNGGVTNVDWYQAIGTDAHPVFTATADDANVVNCIKNIDGSDARYFNVPTTEAEAQSVENTDATKFYLVDATPKAAVTVSEASVNVLVNDGEGGYTCANAVLVDKTDYAVPYAYTAENFTYDRTLTTSNMGITSFMLPISIDASEVNGTVYQLASCDGSTLSFTQVTGTLAPNVPYLVENTTTDSEQKLFPSTLTDVSVSAMTPCPVVTDGATHLAFYTKKTSTANATDEEFADKTIYGYTKGQFARAAKWSLPAFHTVIAMPSTSTASKLTIDLDGQLTSIDALLSPDGASDGTLDTTPVDVYSLSGLKLRTAVPRATLRTLPSGVYVVNGQKVVKP